MTKDEALKMAIEALSQDEGWFEPEEAINACKKALEQQEIGDAEIKQMLDDIEYYQKRVEELEQPAQVDKCPYGMWRCDMHHRCEHPPKWQGLTDDEIVDWFEECFGHDEISETTMWFAKRLLNAVKEKNHG
jgi:hypothetical protein